MRARFGGSSNGSIISAWPFRSSQGTTTYETVLHNDGVLTCNCPGWTRAINKVTGLRGCKHVKEVLAKADLIMNGKRAPEFVNSDGVITNPRVVERVVIKEVPKFMEKVVERVVIKEIQQKQPVVEFRGSRRLLRTIPNSTD